MNSKITIRLAKEDDLGAINDIYNYYVLNSTCTYQTIPETLEGRKVWFAAHGENYPIIVAESEAEIVGWASISKYHPRDAARYTVEDSVYLRYDFRGKGLGRILLEDVICRAKELGYKSVVGAISGDQEASLALHVKLGFSKAAHLYQIAYKFDTWIDLVCMQLML